MAGAPRRLRGRLPAPLRDVERRVMLARPSHPEAGARRRGVAASRNRFPHLPRRRARSWSPTSGSTSRCRAARAAHQGGSLNTARSAETAVAAEAKPKAERTLLQRSRARFPALQSATSTRSLEKGAICDVRLLATVGPGHVTRSRSTRPGGPRRAPSGQVHSASVFGRPALAKSQDDAAHSVPTGEPRASPASQSPARHVSWMAQDHPANPPRLRAKEESGGTAARRVGSP